MNWNKCFPYKCEQKFCQKVVQENQDWFHFGTMLTDHARVVPQRNHNFIFLLYYTAVYSMFVIRVEFDDKKWAS